MTKKEKEILKKAIEYKKGLLSPAILINSIAEQDRRSVENLVVKKYFEEVPQYKENFKGDYFTVNFYRVTEKGLLKFSPWYQKVWLVACGDVRTVIITIITASVTTLITIFIERLFH
ncbi:hypothetical protein D4R87_00415 [bacterium]|nr:MAG: hypothetical protein D4R87_00415 [bacterium]